MKNKHENKDRDKDITAVLRYTVFYPVLLFLLTFLLTSCCVRDWYHDWRYGDNPVPTTGIAPNAAPAPGEFTEEEAVAYVTDDLILVLSTLSVNGLPSVICGQDALARAVCAELLRSRVIEQRFGIVDYSLMAEKKDGSYLVRLYSRQGKCEYSRSLKLKGETAQK